MNAIPKDTLVQTTPSLIYLGEINGQGQPTLQDIMKPELDLEKEIKNNPIGSCKFSFRERIYEPLLLPINSEDKKKTNGECLWSCIKEQYIGQEKIEIATAGSGFVPKKLLGVKIVGKASPFASYFSALELKHSRLKIPMRSLPSVSILFRKPFFGVMYTNTVFAFVGRWVPWIGWVLLAKDIIQISLCTKKCIEKNKDILKNYPQS